MRTSIQALVAAVVSGAALWWGLTNVAVAVREREPLEITCADYVAQRPDAHWLRLTECSPDLADAGQEVTTETRAGEPVRGTAHVTAVYVPLRAAGATKGAPHIIVRRTDPGILYVVSHTRDDASFEQVSDRVTDSLREPTQGLIEPGPAWSDAEAAVIDKLPVAGDAVVVVDGARPPFGFALVICALGLGALAWFAWCVRQLVHTRRRGSVV